MKLSESLLGCFDKHKSLKVNRAIIKALNKKKIQHSLKEGMELKIPLKGFLEGPSRINSNVFCTIGAFSYNHASFNRTSVIIGRYCSISNVRFMRSAHPIHLISSSPYLYEEDMFKSDKKTLIKNDVWIADNVTIKQGITLHNGSCVGANAVVTKDVPAYAIVAGNPAKIIKYRFDEKTIERLLKLKWWQYNILEFKKINYKLHINDYLDELEKLIQTKQIQKYKAMKIDFKELEELAKNKTLQVCKQNSLDNINSFSAQTRIKSHLAYKLGQAMIINSKSFLGIVRMPYVLSYIKEKHQKEQEKYNQALQSNPNLKLPPLESLSDYNEAIKIKNYFSYKLGEALIHRFKTNSKSPFKFIYMGGGIVKFLFYDVFRIRKEFRKGK